MYIVKTQQCFDAAHFLADYDGKCRNIHGHRWTIEVEIGSITLESDGMVIDFKDLKEVLNKEVDYFDHSFILERNSLKPKTYEALLEENFRLIEVDFRPTAENFARYFYDLLEKKGFEVELVSVYETPNNCASYRKEKK